jgi:hypothetical protein
MITQTISGISYECDGISLRASVNGQAYGPALVADARALEDGSMYIAIGALHVVLTEQAWALLMGWPVPAAPVEEKSVAEEVAEVVAASEETTAPEVEVAPVAKRGRRKSS